MIPGADKSLIKFLETWVSGAETDEGKEERIKSVETILFGGADDKEVERIRSLFGVDDEKTTPSVLSKPPVPDPPKPPRAPVKLYDPNRRGYRRSTNEEGIGEDLKKMHAEASGTPFFGDKRVASETMYTDSAQWARSQLLNRLQAATPKKTK